MIPLILKPWEVKAILSGRMTQIRRPVRYAVVDAYNFSTSTVMDKVFGSPGDIVCGKETWAIVDLLLHKWASEEKIRAGEECWYYSGKAEPEHKDNVIYYVDYPECKLPVGPWRSPATMPQWASRIKMRNVKTWVERLEEISDDDISKVVTLPPDIILPAYFGSTFVARRGLFVKQWQSDYGKKYPASSNPWVWCCEFEVMK